MIPMAVAPVRRTRKRTWRNRLPVRLVAIGLLAVELPSFALELVHVPRWMIEHPSRAVNVWLMIFIQTLVVVYYSYTKDSWVHRSLPYLFLANVITVIGFYSSY